MSLLKNFATVGGATATSRVLGFIRDIFIAAALGAGPVAEAFFVAQRLPNLFRRIFAEGGFASAFVPLFTKTHESDGEKEALRFAEESLAALAAAVILVSVIAEIGMVWLTFALAPGFVTEPDKFELAVLLSRIAFPYLALISVVTLFSGMLNGVGRFAAAAFSPSVLNLVLIAALVYIYSTGEIGSVHAGVLLTSAITVGGVIQVLFLYVACRRAGIAPRLRLPRMTDSVKRLTSLAWPSVIAGGITQINIVVGTIIASLQAGAVSWLYYADRLYQLPLGIVGIAIGVVLLPDLSRALRAGRDKEASHTQNRSIEFAAALTLPAAVALFVIPWEIVQVLFQHGAFSAADAAATAPALAAYAAGLPAFVAIKVLQPGFFAREDTRTPMRYAFVSMVVNVVAAFALFYLFGHVGIAAATSIAAWVNTALLFMTLKRRGHLDIDPILRRRLPLLLVASLVMGVGLWFAAIWLAPWLGDRDLVVEGMALAVLILIGLLLFAVSCQVSGAFDFRRVAGLFRRRRT